MGDCGQEVGVSSRVIVSNNQVCRLATRGGMTVMIRSWEPRLLFTVLEVVQNLDTKEKRDHHPKVSLPWRKGRDWEVRRWNNAGRGGVDDPKLLRDGVVRGLCGHCSGVQGDPRLPTPLPSLRSTGGGPWVGRTSEGNGSARGEPCFFCWNCFFL